MDGKDSRRLSSINERPRRWNVVDFGKKFREFLVVNRQTLLAGILVTGIIVLLFGVFSRFQEQVSAGNVLAVSIQNGEVNALLAHPLQQGNAATKTQASIDAKQRSL